MKLYTFYIFENCFTFFIRNTVLLFFYFENCFTTFIKKHCFIIFYFSRKLIIHYVFRKHFIFSLRIWKCSIFFIYFLKNQSNNGLISGYHSGSQTRQSHVHIKYTRSSYQNIPVEDPQKMCSPFLWIRTFKFSAHHVCSGSFLVSLQYFSFTCVPIESAFLFILVLSCSLLIES